MTPRQFKESLAQAEALRQWMRANAVDECSLGDVALKLSKAVPVDVKKEPLYVPTPEEADAILAQQQQDYEDLLFASSGTLNTPPPWRRSNS